MSRRKWIELDFDGLARIVTRRGGRFIGPELIQNALDAGAKNVTFSLSAIKGRPQAKLFVEDDGLGFPRLTDAFTIFQPSLKAGDPELRGRYNSGEKLVLTRCTEARIETVTGTVVFNKDGSRQELRTKREKGTTIAATVKMKRSEVEEALEAAKTVIPPEGCILKVNGEIVMRPKFVGSSEATLPTEFADDKGILHRTKRKTSVSLYRPRPGEQPQLYELGIPVVDLSDEMPYHVDVHQRIPLDMERTSVPPSYVNKIFKVVLEIAHTELKEDTAAAGWVMKGMVNSDIKEEAVRSVIDIRFGEDAVRYDLNDREGSDMSTAEGRTVVHGGTFTHEQWEAINRIGGLPAAGQITPSDIKPPPPSNLPPQEPDACTQRVMEYARWVAGAVGVFLLSIEVIDRKTWRALAGFSATGDLILNKGTLGKAWFQSFPENIEGVTALLLHEYAHSTEKRHLTCGFVNRVAELGAKFASAVAADPDTYNAFAAKKA